MTATMNVLVLLLSLVLVDAQIYDKHTITGVKAPVSVSPIISTVEVTVTRPHPIRVLVTSDVWVTDTTVVNDVVTSFNTVYNYVPADPRTVTSVIRVTTTPVFISTIEIAVNPTNTLVSVFTSFVTTTEQVMFWHSITHVSTVHHVESIPVWTTQTLVQEETVTVTNTVTSVKTVSTRYTM